MTIGNSNATIPSTTLPQKQLTRIFNLYAGAACHNVADFLAIAFDGGRRDA